MSSAVRTATREILATAVRRNTNRTSSSSLLYFTPNTHSPLFYISLSLSLVIYNTVYELAKTLPQYGVGSKFTKIHWEKGTNESKFPPTFWTLTKILPKANGRTGKGAYGILTWKGRQRMTEEKIGGTHKTIWKVVDDEEEFRGIEEDGLKLTLPPPDGEEEGEKNEKEE
jgi:hypothetical protein